MRRTIKSYPHGKADKKGICDLYTKLSTLSTDEITKFMFELKSDLERTFCEL